MASVNTNQTSVPWYRKAAGAVGAALNTGSRGNQSLFGNKAIDVSATLQNYGGNKSGSFLSSIVKPQQVYASDGGGQSPMNMSSTPMTSVGGYAAGGYAGGSTGGQTGGNTGGGGQSQPQGGQNVPYEQIPGESGVNWDEIYAPAFSALDQAEQAAQANLQSDIAGAESETANTVQGLKSEEARRLGEFQGQRTTEQGRTESAIAQARRMASEMMQGIQSRYGGSSSVGGAMSEVLGSQATSNIATNQAALQTALSGISQSESALKDKVLGATTEAENWLKTQKANAKAQLNNVLAQIAGKRGELAVDKGRQRQDALQGYRNLVQDIEARNAQFRQRLYMEAQQNSQKLTQLKQSTMEKFTAGLQAAQGYLQNPLTVGGQTLLPQIPGATWTKTPTTKEEDDLTMPENL